MPGTRDAIARTSRLGIKRASLSTALSMTLAALAVTSSARGQRLDRAMPPPLPTREFERSFMRALLGEGAAASAPTRPEIQGPALAALASIEPFHDDYLKTYLALHDVEMRPLKLDAPDLADGGTLRQGEQHERGIRRVRRAALDAEELFFHRASEAAPEERRSAIEALRLDRARGRLREELGDYWGWMSVEVADVVERAGLSPDARAAIDSALDDYERKYRVAAERYLTQREKFHDQVFEQLLPNAERFEVACRAGKEGRAEVDEIRGKAFLEARARFPLDAEAAGLEKLNRRTLRAVVEALPTDAQRLVLRRVNAFPFDLDDAEGTCRRVDSISRRLIASTRLDEARRAALAAQRAEWLARDHRDLLDGWDLRARIGAIENQDRAVPKDWDSIAAARAELTTLGERRITAAQRYLASIVAAVGARRAARLGVALRDNVKDEARFIEPSDRSDDSGDSEAGEEAVASADGATAAGERAWDDVVQAIVAEGDGEAALAAASRPTGFDDDRNDRVDDGEFNQWTLSPAGAAPPIDRRSLRFGDGVPPEFAGAVAEAHQHHLAEWDAQVEPERAAAADAKGDLRNARNNLNPSGGDLGAADSSLERVAQHRHAALAAALALDAAFFDALDRRAMEITDPAVAADARALIAAQRLARLWEQGGRGRDREWASAEMGDVVDVNVSAWAVDDRVPPAARRDIAQGVVPDSTGLVRTFAERARLLIDQDVHGARFEIAWRIQGGDPRFDDYWKAAADASIPFYAEMDANDRRMLAFTRDRILSAIRSVNGDERAAMRRIALAALLPRIAADRDSPETLITTLIADPELADAEREAVAVIASAYQAAHAAASDRVIDAALTLGAEEPRSEHDKIRIMQQRIGSIARADFDRNEANAKAMMHLRRALPAHHERVPGLALDLDSSP